MRNCRKQAKTIFTAFSLDVTSDGDVKLTHDGPVILGGTITFKAELVDSDGQTPSGTFIYTWRDNALKEHYYKVSILI